MRSFNLVWLVVFAVACSQTTVEKPEKKEVVVNATGLSTEESTERDLYLPVSLNLHRDQIDLEGYKDLGSYHFRRLHFYSKENPGIWIGPAEVQHITLYFIDRYVVKIRYKLSDDISGFLADSLATQAGKKADIEKKWSQYHVLRWRYFSKTITYQNKCPDDDLANEASKELCDTGYWLYAELPGYRNKVKELEVVAKSVMEHLVDNPPHKAVE